MLAKCRKKPPFSPLVGKTTNTLWTSFLFKMLRLKLGCRHFLFFWQEKKINADSLIFSKRANVLVWSAVSKDSINKMNSASNREDNKLNANTSYQYTLRNFDNLMHKAFKH